MAESPFAVLLRDVYLWQKRVVTQWRVTKVVYVLEHGVFGGEGVFVLQNFYGESTVLPTFHSYGCLWRCTDYENPFEFKWLEWLDDSPAFLKRYVGVVLSVLDEQVVMWGADLKSRGCLAFGAICTFTEYIRQLYAYILFDEEMIAANLTL